MDETLKAKLAALGMKTGASELNPGITIRKRLEDLVDCTIKQTMFGEALVIEKQLPHSLHHGNVDLTLRPGAGWIALLTKQLPAVDISSEEYLYLDVETTSLSTGAGSYPFLIGLCRILQNAVVVSQLMMRTPAEEKAMLAELISQCGSAKVVITYNGSSFDLPLIRSRLSLYSLPDPFKDLSHIDLLPVTRKLWKNTLPSRSLSHLEMTLLGVSRDQIEVPGYLIPQIYFDYLRTGDAKPLLGILYHNEMDILSLAALFNFLADDNSSIDILDTLPAMEQKAILKILLDLGEMERAMAVVDNMDPDVRASMDSTLLKRLAQWCKTKNRLAEMIGLLELGVDKSDPWAVLALCSFYEKGEQNLSRAADILFSYRAVVQNSKLAPFSKNRELEKIDRRINRLMKKSTQA